MLYSPFASLVAERERPVSVLVAVTAALATTAPELSVTRPCNVAVMLWPKAAVHNSNASDKLTTFIPKRCCITFPPSAGDQNYIPAEDGLTRYLTSKMFIPRIL